MRRRRRSVRPLRSRALAGADPGRVAQGERRQANGAVGLPLSRRRCHRARLGDAIAREAMQPINERYYRDLGAQLAHLGRSTISIRGPAKRRSRTDYIKRGRLRGGQWDPTLVRVNGNYARGGLGLINELVHENGRRAHDGVAHAASVHGSRRPILRGRSRTCRRGARTSPPGSRSISAAARLKNLHCVRCIRVSCSMSPGRCSSCACCVRRRRIRTRCGPKSRAVICRDSAPGAVVVAGARAARALARLHGELRARAVVTADLRQRIATQLGPFATGHGRWFGGSRSGC